ncbi:15116_t:CDS:2, partial [Gigaspora rosea]
NRISIRGRSYGYFEAYSSSSGGFTVLERKKFSTSANISKWKQWKQTIRTSLEDKIQELKSKTKLQGEKVRALKSLKTDQGTVDAEIATPLVLKKRLASITGEDGSAKSKSKFTLKTKGRASLKLDVLGTRDYNEKEIAIREKVFSTIVSVFKKHGAVTIDTRVFEIERNFIWEIW